MSTAGSLPLVAIFLFGCASAGAMRVPGAPTPGSRTVSGEELRATREADLLEAIQVSRPAFLQARDARRQHPAIYVDGIALAEFDALHTIAVSDVLDVTFLSGPDATTRYGTGHVGGALQIRTRRGWVSGGSGA